MLLHLPSLLPLFFAVGAVAQTAYTDSNTGISFDGYLDSDTGCQFGVALPETLGTDFIAQMVAPANSSDAWVGLDLGSTMTGRLLIVAWPYSGSIISSFRKASGYTTPPVYSGNVSMSTIDNGTFVNSTHFSYTFLCSGCITGDSLTFSDDETGTVFGWAYADTAVTTPSDTSSDLSYHSAGYGEFAVNFTAAESADYSTWASWAVASNSSSSSSNSTTTTTTTTTSSVNTTDTVSNTTYDYIVAGAGPAGIIVAERIAESGASVLLLERGGASTYASGGRSVVSWNDTMTQYDVPALAYYLTDMSETSEYCTDTASEAGCLLGGSSMVNALMYVPPQEKDFDDKWPKGWTWSDVSGAAEKLYERNPGTINPSADGKRYDQGAYNVLSDFFSKNGWSSVNALEEPNKKEDVFSHPPWNIQDGLRAGAVMNYLPYGLAMSNFHLQLNTSVIRAVRNGSYVSGIEVENSNTGDRQIINLNAGGRVILASGALSTPRILFNSGIGPAEQIETVANGSTAVTLPDRSEWIDLPVGEGIKDHPIIEMKFTTNSSFSTLAQAAFTDPSSANVDLFAQADGVLTQAGQRFNFWTSVNSTDGATRYIQGTCYAPSNGTIEMKVYLTHGLTSSGVLGITSDGATEFSTEPYLNTDADKEALASFLDRLLDYTRQADSTLTYTSDSTNVTGSDLLTNYISGDHFVGSAKMGTDDGRNNGTSVVDLNTLVYGTDNLFVVDGSFHPDLPTGNTQTIIMIAAEAAAEKILALNSTSSATSSTAASSTTAVTSAAYYATSAASYVDSTATSSSSASLTSGESLPSGLSLGEDLGWISQLYAAAGTTTSSVAVASLYVVTSAGWNSTATYAATGTTASIAASSTGSSSGTVAQYYQCGGENWSGATECESPYSCVVMNDFYSQCV